MPVIRGTDKIRGVLDISTAGIQLSKGQIYKINDDKFLDHNLQTAIRMGLIAVDEEVSGESLCTKIRIKNTNGRTISIGDTIRDLKDGQIAVLDDIDLKSPAIQSAINKGIIQIIGPVDPPQEIPETTIEVGVIKQEQARELETNEEISPINVIDMPDPPPILPKEIKDPRKAAVTWNPVNNPVMREMKNVTIGKGGKRNVTITEKKDTTEEMERMAKIASGEITNEKEEISFVDQEQLKEGIAKHPILKDKPLPQNQEIDFVG